ncbi:flagellin [candidate division LCP-89 bacterium B3_LCP]|uniref:Flagellin n=1 Tax=candidate division LCP-89 bacterium B3_LCP TaxID=2012998 RepID=A0A532UXW3_UNCL8|nr:MAG: flagellin [candidate division LCP-89 bacterium B3_LCP]
MSTRINHNILSMVAQRSIWNTQNDLDRSVQRLSSGLRINNAWDDPAGLAISERFRAQISSMEEAERNANSDINLMQTAEGALAVLDETLIRMRALSIQSSNGALTSSDRQALDVEFQQLLSEVNRISQVTNYNGLYLLDGSFSSTGVKFHIGTYNTQGEDYYYVNFNSMTSSALGITGLDITSTVTAQNAINSIDTAIDSKDTERTRIGAYVERLQGTISQLMTARERASASESMIRDADIAAEMSQFVRSQILMQTGISMLAQANMVPQMVASLIG